MSRLIILQRFLALALFLFTGCCALPLQGAAPPERGEAEGESLNIIRITLQECLEIAQRASPGLLAERCKVLISKNNRREAEAAFLPGIEARLTHSNTYGSYLEVEGSWLLFGGMERVYNQMSGRCGEQVQEAMLDYARRSVRISVLEAAANVLLARRMADNALSAIEALEAQVEQCSRELEAGKVARSSLMELQAELGEERMAHIESLGNLRNCNIRLMEAIGMERKSSSVALREEIYLEDLELEGLLQEYPLPSYEHLCQSVDSDPEIVACRAESLRQEYSLKAAYGALLPKISAGYLYSRGASNSPIMERRWEIKAAIPIFNGRSASLARRNAALNLEISRRELQQKELALQSRLEEAWNNAITAGAKVEAAKERLRAAEEALRCATLRLNAGSATGMEYIVSRSSARRARLEYDTNLCKLLLNRMLLQCYCK